MKKWLRFESFCLLILTLLIYFFIFDYSFFLLIVLLFLFDFSMIGYVMNPRIGAICYNIFHHLALPTSLLLLGYFLKVDFMRTFSLIWFIHIFMDRTLGYGLKKMTHFKETHLSESTR
ncbi:DUF4260 family protein [Enterococcus sp.]|uniref:DUF4260 family protein n=1 Tax=Enterococcus sp. TaxID=35783 RepID=UPI002FCAA26E